MNITHKLLFLIAALVSTVVHATQVIELVDGSKLRAEVIAFDNGTYTLRSETLGEMQIKASKIKSIEMRENTNSAPISSALAMEDIRKSIIDDPDAMNKIKDLQNDPLVQHILSDETTMRAINSGDLSSLMNNPKIKELMQHSAVRDLLQGATP